MLNKELQKKLIELDGILWDLATWDETDLVYVIRTFSDLSRVINTDKEIENQIMCLPAHVSKILLSEFIGDAFYHDYKSRFIQEFIENNIGMIPIVPMEGNKKYQYISDVVKFIKEYKLVFKKASVELSLLWCTTDSKSYEDRNVGAENRPEWLKKTYSKTTIGKVAMNNIYKDDKSFRDFINKQEQINDILKKATANKFHVNMVWLKKQRPELTENELVQNLKVN